MKTTTIALISIVATAVATVAVAVVNLVCTERVTKQVADLYKD